jgi:hypothetical protein
MYAHYGTMQISAPLMFNYLMLLPLAQNRADEFHLLDPPLMFL